MSPRIENMDVFDTFGVKSVQRRGGAEAGHDGDAGGQIEASELDNDVGLRTAVYARPQSVQPAESDFGFELTSRQVLAGLPGGDDAVLSVEQLEKRIIHEHSVISASPAWPYHVD
jgi:hypothetical protein